MNQTLSMPMVALRGMTVLPGTVVHFDVSRSKSIEAVHEAMSGEQKIFLVTQKDIEVQEPGQEDLYRMGTIATIKQIIKLPKQILRVVIAGEERAVLNVIEVMEPYMVGNVTVIPEEECNI